jgi:hypothetical protein
MITSDSGPSASSSALSERAKMRSSRSFDPLASSELKAGKIVALRLLGTTESRLIAFCHREQRADGEAVEIGQQRRDHV